MWNASSVSHNAIVDVRRRRHEMIFLNISETTRASNLEINQNVSLDNVFILSGNDVIIYFR